MAAVKKTISISEELFVEATTVSKNFSTVVSIALEEYINKLHVKKAMNSFGSWEKRKEDSVEIANQLREEKGRNYAKRSD